MSRTALLIMLVSGGCPAAAQMTDCVPSRTSSPPCHGKLGYDLVFDDSNLFRIRPFRPVFRPTPHNELR